MRERDDRFQVAAVGVPTADRVLLKALVNLTPASEHRRWSFVDEEPAAVVVVDVDSPEGRAYLEGHAGGMLITLGSGPRPTDVYPHLDRPIRNQDLRDILRGVEAQLHPNVAAEPPRAPARARPTPAPAAQMQRPAAAERISGSDKLARLRASLMGSAEREEPPPAASANPAVVGPAWHPILLRLRLNNHERLLFTLPTGARLAVDPRTDQGYLASGSQDVESWGDGGTGRVGVERIGSRQLAEIKEDARVYPLDKLRWLFSIQFSGGTLLADPAAWTEYRLARWPDFGRLPFRRQYARLARMLLSRPATVRHLVRHGDMSESEVIAFLNASYLCGWLVPSSAVTGTLVTAPTMHSRPGLLHKLRRSLGI